MDFMTPPMFDHSTIVVWKIRMTVYLQTLGHKVYLTITKESFLSNSKHIGANAQALEAQHLANKQSPHNLRDYHKATQGLYAPEKERGNCCKDFFESDEKITTRLFLPVTREGGC